MRSNYKRIGDYIQKVDNRNTDLSVSDLRGLSMTKEFRKSTSNTVGTDMSKYKIVKRSQFACDFMSVIRVFKLPVVLHKEDSPVIVSPAYAVFEIEDASKLLPEYLMMWMRRPEFDRYADFKCDSAIRGGFAWEELCDVQLPVPSIEKQREIVKEYQAVVDRIQLNEQLNQKLEDTAQAIYRHWFVDFEFPMSAEYAQSIGKPELEGQPYKSSGGEMEFNSVLDQDVPKGWSHSSLSSKGVFRNGKSRPSTSGLIPVYGGNGIMDYTGISNECDIVTIGRVGAYCGAVHRVHGECWVSDNAICAKSEYGKHAMLYYLLKSLSLNERSEGTGQPLVTQTLLNSIQIPSCTQMLEAAFDSYASKILKLIDIFDTQLARLRELSYILLSRISVIESEKRS